MMLRGAFAAAVLFFGASAALPPAKATPVYDVVGTDYAFKAPAEVASGRIAFRFLNHGKQRHELNIARLKPGVTVDDYVKTVKKGETVKALIEGTVGVIFAEPGQSSYAMITTDAKPGSTYAVICVFRDSQAAQRHFEMGMYTRISVSRSPAPPTPTVIREDTIVGTEYAFAYPRKLTAGTHTIGFRNAGKFRHELNIDMLAKGVTLARVQAAEKANASVDSLFDKSVGVLHAYAGQSPFGRLTFEVIPGRVYLIGCYFTNDDKSPEHYKLGMYGSMEGVAKPARAR